MGRSARARDAVAVDSLQLYYRQGFRVEFPEFQLISTDTEADLHAAMTAVERISEPEPNLNLNLNNRNLACAENQMGQTLHPVLPMPIPSSRAIFDIWPPSAY